MQREGKPVYIAHSISGPISSVPLSVQVASLNTAAVTVWEVVNT